MKRKISLKLLLLLVIIIISACQNEVKVMFEQRKQELKYRGEELFGIFENKDLTKEQRESLEFLYAYMSLNDLADYDGSFFYKQSQEAFKVRDYFSWGKRVPDDLFRHFVLPPRVNNEDLDSSRFVFFDELKDRIKNMTMHDAALEVNHWCHERITYRSSDNRTSSPLASIKTGYGRCGEESTLTVTALRAVGIPARQCYTPRWAHTDDNHAWVEVWCDGKWYFMGACEPEPELNKAWFTYPAKRAMMVHTNVFGKYNGPESKTEFPLYTKINVLENYTDTKKLDVIIYDVKGNKIDGAEVKFQLYNYADYYPIYEIKTDKQGKAEVISGLGDLLVWAAKDGKYGYKKVSLVQTSHIELTLDRVEGAEYEEDMDIDPPVDKSLFSKDTSTKTEANMLRLKYEDSLRTHYISTFITKKEAYAFAKKHNLDTSKVALYLLKSEGNYQQILNFIEKNEKNIYVLKLLSTLTDKDLRDTPEEILQGHLDNALSDKATALYRSDIYTEGVLSPRISTELIRNWRLFLREKFKTIFPDNTNGEEIKKWIHDNILIVSDQNYSKCIISPIGVYKSKMADKLSRDVFYVALCRSFFIPTKIDQATSQIKQYVDNEWKTIRFDIESPVKATGNLTLNYEKKNSQVPQYWTYYTLAKYENGFFVPLDFENDARVAKFPVKLTLEIGYYRICTGNRYADGRVLAHNEYFNI